MENTNIKTNFNDYLKIVKTFLEIGAVIGAIKINLFDLIENNYLSAEEIQQKLNLKCNLRNLVDFLDKLYVCKHLYRQFNKENNINIYKTSGKEFVRSNPENIVSYMLMIDRFLKRMVHFPELLQGGQIKGFEDTFEVIFKNKVDSFSFLKTMAMMHVNEFELIAERFDFHNYKSVLDVGGALGVFSIIIKKKHEYLECMTFDLPKVEEYTKIYLEEEGMTGKISIISGDMFVIEDYPNTDIVVMGNLSNDWNEEKKKILFKNAYNCLNKNGIFIVNEEFIDEERNKDSKGLNLSFYMFIETNSGFNITIKELEILAKEAGFLKTKDLSAEMGSGFVVCYK